MAAAVITGLGVMSAFGRGTDALWSEMAAGRDGLRRIERFPSEELDAPLCGMVPEHNAPASGALSPDALCIAFATAAGSEALARAGIDPTGPARVALVMGTSPVEARIRLHTVTGRVADALGIRGPRLTVSTACTSSAGALALALDLLAQDAADVVLAGGADVLTPLVVAGFRALGVLVDGKCAPFSAPVGVSLGEGAGFLVLERGEHAALRGAAAPFALLGAGLSSDGYHDTGPDPTGAGVARAMRAALRDAGLPPDAVDYVNAHGTGTQANDPAEWRAIQQVFGPRADAIPVSSSKSFLGHAQSAAGVLELAVTLVALEHGTIPPTQRFTVARPHSPPDPVAQETPRPAACRVALSTSSAFGGANCAVVIGRRDGAPVPATARARREVFVAGLGAVGPHGATLDALADALGGGRRAGGHAAPFRLADALPAADPRGLDPITRYLAAAAALSLADGRVRLRGPERERAGILAGIDRVSAESDGAIERVIDAHGLRHVSAALFARMVLNAPVGTAARLLGLKGPTSTLSAGDASGLLAVACAAELVAGHDDVDHLVAGGAEELPLDAGAGASEGAACALLVAGRGQGRRVRLAGWGIAGPDQTALAREAALAMAAGAAGAIEIEVVVGGGPGPTGARRVDPAAHLGDTGAASSAFGLVAAALLLARGKARSALVEARDPAAASCAVVLIADDGGGGHHVP